MTQISVGGGGGVVQQTAGGGPVQQTAPGGVSITTPPLDQAVAGAGGLGTIGGLPAAPADPATPAAPGGAPADPATPAAPATPAVDPGAAGGGGGPVVAPTSAEVTAAFTAIDTDIAAADKLAVDLETAAKAAAQAGKYTDADLKAGNAKAVAAAMRSYMDQLKTIGGKLSAADMARVTADVKAALASGSPAALVDIEKLMVEVQAKSGAIPQASATALLAVIDDNARRTSAIDSAMQTAIAQGGGAITSEYAKAFQDSVLRNQTVLVNMREAVARIGSTFSDAQSQMVVSAVAQSHVLGDMMLIDGVIAALAATTSGGGSTTPAPTTPATPAPTTPATPAPTTPADPTAPTTGPPTPAGDAQPPPPGTSTGGGDSSLPPAAPGLPPAAATAPAAPAAATAAPAAAAPAAPAAAATHAHWLSLSDAFTAPRALFFS